MAFDREKTLQIAQKYIDRRKYDRAILEYQKVVQHDPNDARTLLRIGDLQARLGAYPQAIGTYDRVALYYAGRGFSLKAVAVLKQIRELIDRYAPQLADQYSHVSPKLAQIYAELGLTNDALATYDGVARRMQGTGRDRDAVEIIRRMVALERSNPLSYLRLAEALCRVNRLDEAMEHFWSAAQLLTQQGRPEDAIKVLERILHFRSDTRVARVAAELYIGRGTRDAGLLALARLQLCFEADPRDLDTLGLLAQAFQLIGQASKGIEVYKEMVRLASEAGRPELAQRYVEKLMELSPDDEHVRALAALQRARALSGHGPESASASQPTPGRPSLNPVSVSPIPVSLAPEEIISEVPSSLSEDEIEFIEEGSVDDDAEELEAEAEDGDDELEVKGLGHSAYDEAPTSVSPGLQARSRPSHTPEVSVSERSEPPLSAAAPSRPVPPPGFLKKALVDAESFRGLKLYSKASGLLRSVLSLAPSSLEVRAALQQVLLEAGNHPGAIEQMLATAAIYVKRGQLSAAEAEVYHVLELAPELPEALRMLRQIEEQSKGPPSRADGPLSAGPRSAPEHEAFELRRVSRSPEEASADAELQKATGQEAPLPAYALDEERASAAGEPRGMAGEGGFRSADEPFESVRERQSELPRFSLESEPAGAREPGAAGTAPGAGGESARQAPAVQLPADEAEGAEEKTAREGRLPSFSPEESEKPRGAERSEAGAVDALPARAPTARTSDVAPDAHAAVREALEEAEFFFSRGLYEDCKTILLDQLQRFPDHPPLLDAMARLEAKLSGESGTRDVGRLQRLAPAERAPSSKPIGLAQPVDSEDLSLTLSEFSEEVDVDELFAKFKEGVKAQISDSDSSTHYDLGVAYKGMGLLPDAVREFEIAANDARRQCNCLAMMGMIYREQGDLDRAAEAYVRGLNCVHKGVEQEMSLYYELGCIYEVKNDPDEAIYYFQRIARRDPSYRDVSTRLAALLPLARRLSQPARAINSEQEFDRAFEDMYDSD